MDCSYVVGIDPGLGGAVAIYNIDTDKVHIYDTPIFKAKNDKEDFNIGMMVEILKPYARAHCEVTAILERVWCMPGQGSSSGFSFGRGRGIWEGILVALGFDLHLVTAQTWKKAYPELAAAKVEQPQILKETKPRKANEIKAYKDVKRDYDRQRRIAKAGAKAAARALAGRYRPELASQFEQVNSDGRAEALLMALYAKENLRSKKCRRKKK